MKIVVAPQALKGSLDAPDVGSSIAAGIRAVFPDADIQVIPVADGGEGTVSALVAATGGRLHRATVTGPRGEPVAAEFGILGATAAFSGRTAVIEMAAASGLPLIPLERRDPRVTTTRGTGELMRAALDLGCERILVGIGGSATNDGGAGMAQALGSRLLDADGAELPPGGAALTQLAHIDLTSLDPRLQRTEILVACDVTNPLYGPEGASAIYGPQKGATPEIVRELDAALRHYAGILRRDLGAGLGAGLLAFAHAQLTPGAPLILKALDFDARLQGVALVITAEGRLDAQTAYGKAVGAVASAAKHASARTIALVGSLAADEAALAALGIDVAIPIAHGPLTLEESMARAAELLTSATTRALRLIQLGQELT
jgi:glycerate kinase